MKSLSCVLSVEKLCSRSFVFGMQQYKSVDSSVVWSCSGFDLRYADDAVVVIEKYSDETHWTYQRRDVVIDH